MELLPALVFFAGAIVYCLLCRWVGDYAASKGYTYWGFAILSLVITPLWGWLLAAIVSDRNLPRGSSAR